MMWRIWFLTLVCLPAMAVAESLHKFAWLPQEFLTLFPRERVLSQQLMHTIHARPEPLKKPQITPVKIAVLLPNDHLALMRTDVLSVFKQRMMLLNIDYRLDLHHYTQDDADVQLLAQYARVIESLPDYLITTLERPIQHAIVGSILAQDRTKVLLFDVSHPIKAWQYHPPLLYAGVRYDTAHQQLAQYLQKEIEQGALFSIDVVLSNSYLRNQALCNSFIDVLFEHSIPLRSIYQSGQQPTQVVDDRRVKRLSYRCSHEVNSSMADTYDVQWRDERDLDAHHNGAWATLVWPFKQLEISMAEVIRNHLDKVVSPQLMAIEMTSVVHELSTHTSME